MAQAEDTELRDLVIETLERNGSLAKIRALLRANIFLAFEDECENIKQNVDLDNVLKLPEGKLALSVIHEFLEFCCLKNTLVVYKTESRQGSEYKYDGKKNLTEKLDLSKHDTNKEPILITLIKNVVKSQQNKYYGTSQTSNYSNDEKCDDKNYRDEQNCTYILHEDSQSSTTSNSQSDNYSSDEKNKLHLRLQLDNSDTDTSSDSARDKTSSEYIPGDHILQMENSSVKSNFISPKDKQCLDSNIQDKLVTQERLGNEPKLSELKLTTTSSSDSTSYLELKPFNALDEKMLKTSGFPIIEANLNNETDSKVNTSKVQVDEVSVISPKLNESLKKVNDNMSTELNEKHLLESGKSDTATAEFSYGDDFSSSPISNVKDITDKQVKTSVSLHCESEKSLNKNTSLESPHQTSQSSQSSISISDVADLISEKSSLGYSNKKFKASGSIHSKDNSDIKHSKIYSDDSGDFSGSSIPSLSNLSLDIHSE